MVIGLYVLAMRYTGDSRPMVAGIYPTSACGSDKDRWKRMNGLMDLRVATHQKKVRIWQQRPGKVSFIEKKKLEQG